MLQSRQEDHLPESNQSSAEAKNRATFAIGLSLGDSFVSNLLISNLNILNYIAPICDVAPKAYDACENSTKTCIGLQTGPFYSQKMFI